MKPAARAVLGTVGGGSALTAAVYFSPALAFVVAGILLIAVVGILVIAGSIIHRDSDKPIDRVMRILEIVLSASRLRPSDSVPEEMPVEKLAVPEQPALLPAPPRQPSRRRPPATSGSRPPTGSGKR